MAREIERNLYVSLLTVIFLYDVDFDRLLKRLPACSLKVQEKNELISIAFNLPKRGEQGHRAPCSLKVTDVSVLPTEMADGFPARWNSRREQQRALMSEQAVHGAALRCLHGM